ncbi:MAG: sigma-70 family RNA polymerase sigma factor, partial [Chitinophagaceae bacterium]|nr:sigma-70 family RNA polymerase sigma factor [Chitinophagaceae bacterium]
VYTHLRRSSSNAPFFTTLEEILESSFAADEKIISAEIRNLITLWLEALPKKRRQIFLLRHLDGLTTQEIADRMDISQKTVQNQLNTAAIDIRARLTQLGVFVVILLYK